MEELKKNKKVLTVTMNPAIDIQYRVDNFQINKVIRTRPPRKTAGGKGLNVSRVMEQLGKSVTATGVLGDDNGRWIRKQLSATSIQDEFIEISSNTRECIAIIGSGSQTELLGDGTLVKEKELSDFFLRFKELIKSHGIICISGSLPGGVRKDFYRELISEARSTDCHVILDTSGSSLKEALTEGPFLIKPNKEELEAILNKTIETLEDIKNAGNLLRSQGAQNILISLGEKGAVFVGDETYHLEIPEIKVKNPVGSGDASVAGFAYGLSEELPLRECLAYSMACGLSNAMNEETGKVVPIDVIKLKTKIKIKRI